MKGLAYEVIDFSPLKQTLKERNIKISDMRQEFLHPRTISKINKNQDVNLSTVAKICDYLDVPIEKVVKINRR